MLEDEPRISLLAKHPSVTEQQPLLHCNHSFLLFRDTVLGTSMWPGTQLEAQAGLQLPILQPHLLSARIASVHTTQCIHHREHNFIFNTAKATGSFALFAEY